MRTLAARLVILLGVVDGASAAAQSGNNQDVFDSFFRYVEPRGRVGAQPTAEDSVDLFTGTLRVNHVEFSFPGKAGLDLTVVRHYSSRIWSRVDGTSGGAFIGDMENSALGLGWSIHFGRLRNPNGSGVQVPCGGGDYPVLEDGDGSARVFYPVSPGLFRSRDYWALSKNCTLSSGGTGICVTDTQGRTREFSNGGQYFVGLSPVWPMLKIRDIHGNSISATYHQGGKVNTITDTVGRTVTFNYGPGTGCPSGSAGPGCLTSLVARKGASSRTVTYTYRTISPSETYGPGRYILPAPGKPVLTDATPQLGLGYSYDYWVNTPITENQFALKQMTNPLGGTTDFEYGRREVFTGSTTGVTIPMAFLTKRTISGPSLPSAIWQYEYVHPSNLEHATVTVTRPDTSVETHKFFGFGDPKIFGQTGRVWRVGLQASVDRAGLQQETFEWDSGPIVANANYSAPAYQSACDAWAWDTTVRNPYVRKKTTVRGMSRYETEVTVIDQFGQPRTVVETGEAQRSTNRKVRSRQLEYNYHTPSNRVIGRVRSESTCLGPATCLAACPTGCTTTARTYLGINQLVDSETVKGIRTEFTYHSDGALDRITDGNAKTMTVTYTDGQPTNFDFGGSFSVGRSYAWDGQQASATSARGHITSYEYDAAGRLAKITPPVGNDSTIVAYDSTGRIVTETTGTGVTAYEAVKTSDGFGREVLWTNVMGDRKTIEYDSLGRVVFESEPFRMGQSELGVRLEYDALGRVTKTTKRYIASGHRPLTGTCAVPSQCDTVTITPQPDHCLSEAVTRKVNDTVTTKRCFESFGDISSERLEKVTDANGKSWSYIYDVADNLTSFSAPLPSGNRSFRFDPGTSTLKEFRTGPRGTTLITMVDGLGNVRSQTDGRGVVQNLDYNDPLSRISGIRFPSAPLENVTRTYEGHLLKTVVPGQAGGKGGAYKYTYDSVDRPQEVEWVYAAQTYLTKYRYTAAGCLDRLEYPTGTVLTMTCDRTDRPTSVTISGTTIASNPTYDAAGRLTAVTYGNGKSVSTTYVHGRVQTVSSQGVVNLTYSYDGAENVVSVVDGIDPSKSLSSITYDKLDQLTTVVSPGGTYRYEYDELGNRKLAAIPGQADTTYTYDTAGTGRLTQSTGPEAPPPMSMTWSATERIATSSDGSTYEYDGLGRRVRKTNATASVDVVFHYDTSGHLLAETSPTGQRIREYIYFHGRLIAVRGCLTGFSVACSDIAYLHTDIVGSVVAKSDQQGNVTTRMAYSPFGASTPSAEPIGFNGRWNDLGIAGMNFGARVYLAQLGRFASADTAWLATTLLHSNSYTYVLNNPYKYKDPSGHVPFLVITGAIGAVVGGVAAAYLSYDSETGFNGAAIVAGVAAGAVTGATLGAATAYVATGSATAGVFATAKGAAVGLGSMVGLKLGSDTGFQRRASETAGSIGNAVTSVFHKGKLGGGVVSPDRTLSTGLSLENVSRLDRAGRVWEFRIPTEILNRWRFGSDRAGNPLVQILNDFDKQTGVTNVEYRFSPQIAAEMQKFLVK